MFDSFLLIPKPLMALFFFIYGSFFGSFANVLIYRMLQEGKPLNLFQRSRCPSCSYIIPFYLNIPLFSWFFLMGKCRNCSTPFSFRYPVVEWLMACLFSALFLIVGWQWFLLEALFFTLFLVCASFIDLDRMILPHSLTLSGLFVGFLGALLNPERLFLDSVLGFFLGGAILLGISVVYYLIRQKEGMGGGDIVMMAWIGSVLGWKPLYFVLLVACFLGSLVGFYFMLQGNKNLLQKALPFGPFLSMGSLLYIFLKYAFPKSLDLILFFGFFGEPV